MRISSRFFVIFLMQLMDEVIVGASVGYLLMDVDAWYERSRGRGCSGNLGGLASCVESESRTAIFTYGRPISALYDACLAWLLWSGGST